MGSRGIRDRVAIVGAGCTPFGAAFNPGGGLKAFGHSIGASGLRMRFECWLKLRGEAGRRQVASVTAAGGDRSLALTHNLGGPPGARVSFVGVFGSEPG